MAAVSGVFSDLFSFYASAGKFKTAFDGEVHAIYIALKQLLAIHSKFGKVVLLSDSQAAIQAIGSQGDTLSDEVLQCRRLTRLLTLKSKRVVIQWIPSHCNIYGSEQAGAFLLAREHKSFNQVALNCHTIP
nr:uncharacterized protein LOC110282889 [Parasteatoda tepidariorum]